MNCIEIAPSKKLEILKMVTTFPSVTPEPFSYFLFIREAKRLHEGDIQRLKLCVKCGGKHSSITSISLAILISCKLCCGTRVHAAEKALATPFKLLRIP
jgi:hypothetical protein